MQETIVEEPNEDDMSDAHEGSPPSPKKVTIFAERIIIIYNILYSIEFLMVIFPPKK